MEDEPKTTGCVQDSMETPPKQLVLDDLDEKLDRLSNKMDLCISEIFQLRTSPAATRRSARQSVSNVSPAPGGAAVAFHTTIQDKKPAGSISSAPPATGPRPTTAGLAQRIKGPANRPAMPRDSLALSQASSFISNSDGPVERRRSYPVRHMDLRMAWQEYAKTQLKKEMSDLSDDGLRPLMRMMNRSRCDQMWELLDDPSSSRSAWWLSQFFSMFVIASMILSLLEAAEEEPLIDTSTAAWLWLLFDSFFLVEFVCRIMSAPSTCSYCRDWLNWADMVSAFGLPLRASAGFFVEASMSSGNREMVIILFLILPMVRFMKLLRYFESFRLLIDAAKSSAEALPVLCYIMAVITLTSATGMYLVEDRDNIPTIYHAMWLAIVTMTTVGYGDYFPTSLAGYIIASMLTFTSVVFLALPVGIIGHEFTRSWQVRGQVLLKNRIRRCMLKWGYNAKDLRLLIEYVDVNCDGLLAMTEFLELMRQMRIGISVQSAIDLFVAFDDDHNGYIEYDEFLRQIFPEEYVKDTVDEQIMCAYGNTYGDQTGYPAEPEEAPYVQMPSVQIPELQRNGSVTGMVSPVQSEIEDALEREQL